MQFLGCTVHSLQSNRTFLMYKDQYNVIRLINSFTAWNKILTDFNQGVTIQDPSPFPLIKENTLFSPCPRVPLIGGQIFLTMRNGNSWKTENFRKSLRTRKFSTGNFLGQAPTESLCTQDSKYVYERGVEDFCNHVLLTRSWEKPVKRELPANIGRCSKKPPGRNFDFRAKFTWEKFFIHFKHSLERILL